MIAKDKSLAYANREQCFLDKMDSYVIKKVGIQSDEYYNLLYKQYTENNIKRCADEIRFWEKEISTINEYSKEKAVEELINSLKIKEKIVSIQSYRQKLESIRHNDLYIKG